MRVPDFLRHFEEVSSEADGGYLARCPGHGDSRPSLRIWIGDDAKIRLTCRAGCETGTIIRAVGLTWSALFNATEAPVVVPQAPPELVSGAPLKRLGEYVQRSVQEPGPEVLRYARRRFGLDAASARMVIGDSAGADAGMPWLSAGYRAHHRLEVPLRNFDGAVHGLQGRDITGECPARWVGLTNPPGQRWGQYGVLERRSGPAIVTEGPSDALTAYAAGYTAVLVRGAGLMGGGALTDEIATGLRGRTAYIAADADSAGRAAAQRMRDGLGQRGVDAHVIEMPEPGMDLSDWREAAGDAFRNQLKEAMKAAATPAPAPATARSSAKDALDLARKSYGEHDVARAYALAEWSSGHIRYSPQLGFMAWTGRKWEQNDVLIRQRVHEMARALIADGEDATGLTTTRSIDNLLTELRSVPGVAVPASAFDDRPDILSFANGTVELETGFLRPHDPEDLLTYCLDIDYVPDAECPRWEQFLTEVFPGEPELPGYMQQLVGYGITGHTSEQCFCVLWGKGANGKSVLVDTLTRVLDGVTRTTPFATFEDKQGGGIPNDIAALRGARLVMAAEGEAGKPMSESVLKRSTGKDMMAARFLRKEFFEFRPNFLLMLASNHMPRFKSQDEGLWRRVKLIKFNRYFAPDERDPNLDAKLEAEAEGIAAWAVRGAVAWYSQGRRLAEPEVIRNATLEYRESSDALSGFFPGVLVRDEGAKMLGSDAFNSYLEWCEAENLPGKERWTRQTFYAAMGERGAVIGRAAKGKTLGGIRLADARPSAADGPGIFGKD